jgi:hypothetical protein
MTSGHAVVTTCVCACLDISPRGIGIDSPEAMTPGEVVALHSDAQGPRRLARVRHCRQRGGSYRIGLEFICSQTVGGPREH